MTEASVFQDEVELAVPEDHEKIWRYMDFSKYVDLLTTRTLYFSRADKLEDPFDCSSLQFRSESPRLLSIEYPRVQEWTCKVNTFARLFVYLNCWHLNEVQSAALWKLYSENKFETIAIQSTFIKLNSQIENKWKRDGGPYISKVKYDPKNAGTPVGNSYKLLSSSGLEDIIYKRKSFSHEEELRAFIFQKCDKMREGHLKNDAHLEKLLKTREDHIRIEINPSDLIENVYVSPFAKDSFVELVKTISGELKDRILKSDLYELY